MQKNSSFKIKIKFYFKNYHWLHYCAVQDHVICYYCSIIDKKGSHWVETKELAIISDGSKNWKKATSTFKEHEKSNRYQDSMAIAAQSEKKQQLIKAPVNTDFKKQQQYN